MPSQQGDRRDGKGYRSPKPQNPGGPSPLGPNQPEFCALSAAQPNPRRAPDGNGDEEAMCKTAGRPQDGFEQHKDDQDLAPEGKPPAVKRIEAHGTICSRLGGRYRIFRKTFRPHGHHGDLIK
jgi:hypothetical protein